MRVPAMLRPARGLRARRRGMLRALLVLSLTLPAVASTQHAPLVAPVRPIRLEGYWNRTKAEPNVIGEVTISADGRTRRSFGVTAIQAHAPEEEGIQVFRHSALQPVTLLLRGREEMVQRFLAGRPDEKVTAFGVYRADSGTLTLASVEVTPAPDQTPVTVN